MITGIRGPGPISAVLFLQPRQGQSGAKPFVVWQIGKRNLAAVLLDKRAGDGQAEARTAGITTP